MKNLIIFIVLSFVFCVQSFAQDNSPCPTISVSGSSDITPIGEPMTFTANVNSVNLEKLSYQWAVSDGKIIDGQGTLAVKVLPSPGASPTVTIEVIGLSEKCPKTASATFFYCPIIDLVSKKIAEFSLLPPRIHKVQIDNLLIELNNDPTAQGYILETFKRNTPRSLIEQKISNLFAYTQVRKFPVERITLLIAEENEYLTEFWINPAGANALTFDDPIQINLNNYKKDLAKIFTTKRKNSQQKLKKKS